MAAVLLRNKVPKYWGSLPAELQEQIKQHLLQCLLGESDGLIQHAVARVVSMIAKYDLPDGKWPQVLNFVFETCGSQTDVQRGTLRMGSAIHHPWMRKEVDAVQAATAIVWAVRCAVCGVRVRARVA